MIDLRGKLANLTNTQFYIGCGLIIAGSILLGILL